MKLKDIRNISPAEIGAYLRQNVRQILAIALFALLIHDVFRSARVHRHAPHAERN